MPLMRSPTALKNDASFSFEAEAPTEWLSRTGGHVKFALDEFAGQ